MPDQPESHTLQDFLGNTSVLISLPVPVLMFSAVESGVSTSIECGRYIETLWLTFDLRKAELLMVTCIKFQFIFTPCGFLNATWIPT
jgi:hypothetical protein